MVKPQSFGATLLSRRRLELNKATPRRGSPWKGEGDASVAWAAIVASAIHSTAVLRLWLAEFEARQAEHREPETTVSRLGRLAGCAVADGPFKAHAVGLKQLRRPALAVANNGGERNGPVDGAAPRLLGGLARRLDHTQQLWVAVGVGIGARRRPRNLQLPEIC